MDSIRIRNLTSKTLSDYGANGKNIVLRPGEADAVPSDVAKFWLALDVAAIVPDEQPAAPESATTTKPSRPARPQVHGVPLTHGEASDV